MSVCFLSLESSKVFNKIIYNDLEKKGFQGLSEALILLFPYIAETPKPTASQLAKQIGYSRQAMHKNIKKLEEYEYILLTQENQKEKIIKLTLKGEKLMEVANEVIVKIEEELSNLIGKEQLESYKQNQIKIYEYLIAKK